MARPQSGRIALITGASRGIGAAAAVGFAGAGAHVVLVARTVGGLEEVDDAARAAGGEATLVPLDLTQPEGIERLAASLYERWGRLDILLGNAATLGELAPVGHISAKAWQAAFDLNLHANWRLIRAFDPLLRQSPAGRAIFVTAGASHRVAPYWAAYAASKAALDAMVLTYAAETARTTLRVNLFEPPPTRTRLRAQAFPGEEPSRLPPPERLLPTLSRLASADFAGHGLRVAGDAALPD